MTDKELKEKLYDLVNEHLMCLYTDEIDRKELNQALRDFVVEQLNVKLNGKE